MFNKNFYPTPRNIIEEMLKPYLHEGSRLAYNFKDKIILEPSAGKGDIAEFIKNNSNEAKLFCIEIEPELRAILLDKRYNVIDTDFLQHTPDFNYDLIIMNPPFDEGVDHLLHAWDIQESGDIVCLLNEETINNPYSEKRKLLKKIIEDNGTVEFLGNCFSDAERKTEVKTALVRLSKKQDTNKFEFNFKDTEELNFDETFTESSIVKNDVLGNIIVQYEKIKKDFQDLLKLKSKIFQYSKRVVQEYSSTMKNHNLTAYSSNKEQYLSFVQDLKLSIWENIAHKLNLEKHMTSKMRSNFNDYIRQQGNLAITKENIREFVSIIFGTREESMEQAIIDVFDIFTKYYDENREYVEGWKTNERFRVNKKIVLPYGIRYGQYSNSAELRRYGDNFKLDYDSKFEDIDKALCFIAGKDIDSITTIRGALNRKFELLGKVYAGDKFDNSCESTFFNLKFYKKGTLHLEFKEREMWEQFNVRATKGKNWLPEQQKEQKSPKFDL